MRVASTLAVADVAREAHAIEEAARRRLYGHFMQAPFPIAVLRGPRHVTELANPIALARLGQGREHHRQAAPRGHARARGTALPRLPGRGVSHRRRLPGARRAGASRALRRTVSSRTSTGTSSMRRSATATARSTASWSAGFEVTAQVRAAQELSRLLANAEASERQFRELVENLPDLAWTARPDGFIDYYNRRWYEYTGTTFEDMQGWGWTIAPRSDEARRRRSSGGSTRSRPASRSRWSSRCAAPTACFAGS